MTASTGGGGGSCLAMSLSALKRLDPYINNITDLASQVALYTFNNTTNEWEKTNVEGTLFVYNRLASPRHGFTILNRLSMDNLTEPITKDLDFQLQHPFLLYRNARLSIYGIWFYDKEDCQRIAELMKNLAGQEHQLQVQIESGCVSPRAAEQGVDILQMLTKARQDFDKGKLSSEPKEIGSGGVIYGNPHLIKPIPLKPAQDTHIQGQTQQDGEIESKHLSVVTLFGAQSKPDSISPQPSSSVGRVGPARPAVARSLSYDDPAPAGGALASSTPVQHCPAIHKLMSGSLLQPLSESPESRLCENGVVQNQLDPIQRLLMNPPLMAGAPALPSLQLSQGECAVATQIHPKAKATGPVPPHHLLYVPAKAPPTGVGGNVVSPYELLQRLTLVQQEQELHPHQELLQPNLATSNSSISKTNTTQVISPQRIPATVAPTLLLSPSVFAQSEATKAVAEPAETRALSKSQLQATLLHLIRNDASFLNTIYEAYVSRLATDSSSKPF
ncbi:mRNA-decapping enzyme 1B-like [Myxocyprinus asiaticus]|uniref:mRNA-decapping enzyme 1B-like n=1 Tax=Myxocyprinus asiaticus TaxID=70543 RepID=UPI002221516C|nr:mRNA-decapping enzyme 1B-like [Myxocyprinus asiaticus]XP_051547084.1 mRNA-decapping enzyme 1B-like [Myxocyprinus asiaticus]XP_051547085.1 mRNA-decapping enzyme 1B-like [Myxocyprinus asiaticus]XP_051547086.1 mRNA-decapping enzyme 1B-like [Myxocyprinus asiaticus]